MRPTGIALVVSGVLAATAPAARAQETTADRKLVIGGSATVWIPSGDADDFANTSLGVRPQVTYWIIPMVGITGSFDWVFVNEKSGAGVGSVTYYSISAGGRITMPRPMRIKPYGELVLGWHKLSADAVDDSGIGFRIGGGATYALGPSLVASAGLAYSAVSIDTGFIGVDVDAIVLDVGLATRF